jgi:hypothetical protein
MQSVARSTTEAEYVGMGEATKAALWGRRLLAELEAEGSKQFHYCLEIIRERYS